MLATHPLTPRLTPRELPALPTATFSQPAAKISAVSTALPQSTVRGIPPLSPANRTWLGLSFLPLVVAFVSICVGLAHLSRLAKTGRTSGRTAQPRFFLPVLLSLPALAILAGIAATAAALLGLASHVLHGRPATADAWVDRPHSAALSRQAALSEAICKGNYSTSSIVTV